MRCTWDGKETGVTIFGKSHLPHPWTGNFTGSWLTKADELWDSSIRISSLVSFFPLEVIRSESKKKRPGEGQSFCFLTLLFYVMGGQKWTLKASTGHWARKGRLCKGKKPLRNTKEVSLSSGEGLLGSLQCQCILEVIKRHFIYCPHPLLQKWGAVAWGSDLTGSCCG